jgi:ABC-2 type transport system permease protein
MNNEPKYNQIKATLAITRAALTSIFRSPSAVVFSLAFPLIFIVVFGFIGGGTVRVDVALDKKSDTTNVLYKILDGENSGVNLINYPTEELMNSELKKGNLAAIINIQPLDAAGNGKVKVDLKLCDASGRNGKIFQSELMAIVSNINSMGMPVADMKVQLSQPTIVEGRAYKSIDFILPGQLGFSLLASGVFGTAFVFFSLRQTLVLKRFFATPIKRSGIVIGEAIARLIFAMMGSVVIILIGKFAFGFTLIHGVTTFINMLILCALGLIIFMGFGFVVSGLAKNETSIPPLANIITMPQFLLAGTFFSISNFPNWLQPVCKILPLTYLNDALRKVAFEGQGLWEVHTQIFIILGWGAAVYILAIKVFKWE